MLFTKRPENTEEQFLQHAAPGTSAEIRRIRHSSGIDLRCICFKPGRATTHPPILFLPGMGSVIENFTGTLRELTSEFVVYYVETREKRSSRLEGKTGFTVPDISEDITGAVRELGLKDKEYILVGYSLSSVASAEMFRRNIDSRPLLLVLLEPLGRFDINRAELFAAKWLWWSYRLIKPILKYYIRIRRVNARDDYEMYKIICRALDAADPKKLSGTITGISGYSIYNVLDKIDVPVIIIGTSLDKFHGNNEAEEIAVAIPGAEYYDLENNIRSHSAEVADIIKNRIRQS